MSKKWEMITSSARVYDIPWESKHDLNLEHFKHQGKMLDLPKHTNLHLWMIDFSAFDHTPFLNVLSNDEIEKLNRFIVKTERESRVKSRILLRLILSEYLGISPLELEFDYNKNAKPELKNPTCKLSFNISHSGHSLAIVIDAHRSVGVDIETELRPAKVYLRLAKRFFFQQEFNRLESLNAQDQSNLFNQLWTLKEAVLKSTGKGLFLIDEAPDFSSFSQISNESELKFYQKDAYIGFSFFKDGIWLSTAACK